MARKEIDLGALPNGDGGDTQRAANVKINANFVELYTAPSLEEATTGTAVEIRGWSAASVVATVLGWWDRISTPFSRGLISAQTAEEGRTILELGIGEWVDLRPYLKPGFYWNTDREGKNAHPRIRKLSCGKVELDGVVSFNSVMGPSPIDVFVNVPVEFRPPYTCAGLTFADTAEPLSFGAANWIVGGVVEYSPPRVAGDIMFIPLTIASPSREGAISLNNIFWYTT